VPEELLERRDRECRPVPQLALETLDEAEAFLRNRGLLTRNPSFRCRVFSARATRPYRAGWDRLVAAVDGPPDLGPVVVAGVRGRRPGERAVPLVLVAMAVGRRTATGWSTKAGSSGPSRAGSP